MVEISMNRLKKEYLLKGLIDTHLHTAPDSKPRLLSDIEAAEAACKEHMGAIVVKSHFEPTSGRAFIASQSTGFKVFGGVCLNSSVGGLNAESVKSAAAMGGKVVWLPTVSYGNINLNYDNLEDIFSVIIENDLVLATGHLSPNDIFWVLDAAHSMGINRIMVNHPLTRVVGASIEEQKEMSRKAYLEHCYVACMPEHDQLNPEIIADAIKEVGAGKCIMATDFGQKHNPYPTEGLKMFISSMLAYGISWKEIQIMCRDNPHRILLK